METSIKYPHFNPVYFKLDGKPILKLTKSDSHDPATTPKGELHLGGNSYVDCPVINILSIPRASGDNNYRFRYQLLVQNTGPFNGGDITLRNYKLDGPHKNTLGGPQLAQVQKLQYLPVWMGDGVNNAFSGNSSWTTTSNNKSFAGVGGYGQDWANEYQKALDVDTGTGNPTKGEGDLAWIFPHVYGNKGQRIIKLDKVTGGITITFDFEVPHDLTLRDVTTTRDISGIVAGASNYSAQGDDHWTKLTGTGGKNGDYEFIKFAFAKQNQNEINNEDGGYIHDNLSTVNHHPYLFMRFKFVDAADTNISEYTNAGWVESVTSELNQYFDYPLRWSTSADALTDTGGSVTNSISWFNYKNEAITNKLDININKKDVFQSFFIAKTNENLEKSQPSGSGYGQIPFDITDNGIGENRNEGRIGFAACTWGDLTMPLISSGAADGQKFGSSLNEHRIGGLSQTFSGEETETELNIRKYLSPYYIPTPPSIDNEYTVNVSAINGVGVARQRETGFNYELDIFNEILTVGKWNSLFAKMKELRPDFNGGSGKWTANHPGVLGSGSEAWYDFTGVDKDNLIKINVFDSPLDVHFYVKDSGTDSDNLGYYAASGTGTDITYAKRNASWEDTLYTVGSDVASSGSGSGVAYDTGFAAGSGVGYAAGRTNGKLEGPDETNITLHQGWNTIGFTNHGFLAGSGEGSGSGIGLIQNSIHFMQANQYIGQAPQGSGEDGVEGSIFMYGNTGYMVKCDKDINIKWTRRTTETIPNRPTV